MLSNSIVKSRADSFTLNTTTTTKPPNSKKTKHKQQLNIVATFAPHSDRPVNYNVSARVRGKPTPLTLNVKGEGYVLRHAMLLELSDGRLVEMAPKGDNAVDFGQVIVNDRAVRALHLTNSSPVDLEFAWCLGGASGASSSSSSSSAADGGLAALDCLAVRPERGTVPRGGGRVVCELSFAPRSVEALAGRAVACQVTNGARYSLSLLGAGYKPRLALSFLSHDFGPVLVWRPGMEPAVATLRASNEDRQPVSFEVLWGDKEHLAVSERVLTHAWRRRRRCGNGGGAGGGEGGGERLVEASDVNTNTAETTATATTTTCRHTHTRYSLSSDRSTPGRSCSSRGSPGTSACPSRPPPRTPTATSSRCTSTASTPSTWR